MIKSSPAVGSGISTLSNEICSVSMFSSGREILSIAEVSTSSSEIEFVVTSSCGSAISSISGASTFSSEIFSSLFSLIRSFAISSPLSVIFIPVSAIAPISAAVDAKPAISPAAIAAAPAVAPAIAPAAAPAIAVPAISVAFDDFSSIFFGASVVFATSVVSVLKSSSSAMSSIGAIGSSSISSISRFFETSVGSSSVTISEISVIFESTGVVSVISLISGFLISEFVIALYESVSKFSYSINLSLNSALFVS